MSTNLLDELMQSDAEEEASRVPNDADLSRVSKLAERQKELEDEIEKLTEDLEEKQKSLNLIRLKELPEAMKKLRLREIKLEDGEKITIETDYYAGISDAKRERALAWLRANGSEGLIKNGFALSFGKGQDAKAKEVADMLSEMGVPFAQKEDVHFMTLRAFVKESIESRREIPRELFGVVVQDVSKLKKKRKKSK